MAEGLKELSQNLGNPEFITVLIQPVFVYGILSGLLVFLVSLIFKETKAQKLGLILMVASCGCILPYVHLRQQTTDRVQTVATALGADRDAVATSDQRWADSQWVFLTLAAFGILTFFLGHGGKAGVWITIITITVSLATLTFALWLVLQDAKVHHPNLSANI